MHDLHESIEQLKKASRETRKIVKLLALFAEDAALPVENAYILEKQCTDIEKHLVTLPESTLKNELQQWLAAERGRIAENKEEFKIQFGQKLQALFAQKNTTVKGQYPLLRIGFYTLKLDFEFGQATLFFGPEIEKIISRITLHPQAVFGSIISYDKKLRALDHSPQEYLERLKEAYALVIRFHGKSLGEKVLLSDVLREFVVRQQNKRFFIDPQKSHFTEFPRVRLAYILYQIKQAGIAEHGLHFHVATFDATTDKLQSFWILENEQGEGTHYSHISFEKRVDPHSQ
ncbi:hypothetical protein JXB22_06435 [candidate division WOR-3 bacterium]|nr:hypothetical protein [candidate division WOR-3 bacterium]